MTGVPKDLVAKLRRMRGALTRAREQRYAAALLYNAITRPHAPNADHRIIFAALRKVAYITTETEVAELQKRLQDAGFSP